MTRYLKLYLLFLCLLPSYVSAVKVPGLYEVEVPVADQSDESRKSAIQTSLRLVLVKLTGDRYAPGRTALSPLLNHAENYVQQYRYTKSTINTTDSVNSAPPELQLWVRFDKETLDKALRNLSVPVWGKERPSTLLWLAADGDAGRQLISLGSESSYIEVIDKRARLRGISIIFPLLDLEDTSNIRPSDIWGGFREPILASSSRYHADSILTGNIRSLVPGIWEGKWTAYLEGQVLTWVTEGDLPDVVLDEGIDGVADILASQYARTGIYAELAGVKVAVVDIFNVDQYARALKYLSSLNSVTEVMVEIVEIGKVSFMLTAHGGELAVTQAIELGQVLEHISGDEETSYRLLP